VNKNQKAVLVVADINGGKKGDPRSFFCSPGKKVRPGLPLLKGVVPFAHATERKRVLLS